MTAQMPPSPPLSKEGGLHRPRLWMSMHTVVMRVPSPLKTSWAHSTVTLQAEPRVLGRRTEEGTCEMGAAQLRARITLLPSLLASPSGYSVPTQPQEAPCSHTAPPSLGSPSSQGIPKVPSCHFHHLIYKPPQVGFTE